MFPLVMTRTLTLTLTVHLPFTLTPNLYHSWYRVLPAAEKAAGAERHFDWSQPYP